MQSLLRTVSLSVALAGIGGMTAEIPSVAVHADMQPASAQPDACAAPANKIVAENCRPGSPREEWDIADDGDPAIQGFATEMSVNLGETVQFKIKSHSDRYRIDVYRMGWYAGKGARLLETIRPSVPLPQTQPLCRVHERIGSLEDADGEGE